MGGGEGEVSSDKMNEKDEMMTKNGDGARLERFLLVLCLERDW